MKLHSLITKHQLKLTKPIIKSCKAGLLLMRQSVDPMHDQKHIERIFDNLDYLLVKLPEIKKSVTFDTLLLAICWHDSWKSFRNAKNPINFIYHQLIEGIGSASLFKKHAKVMGIDKEIIQKVYYIIRKHSLFQVLPRKTIEVKILIDLDGMEMWNEQRLKNNPDQFFVNKRRFYKKTAKLFYRLISKKKLNFQILEEAIELEKAKIINMF